MALPSSHSFSEVCPSCGAFAVLEEDTGWCESCSNKLGKSKLTVAYSSNETVLASNADAIDYFMASTTESISVWQALRLVRQDRAVCVVCGKPMSRARRNAVFCRRNKECRRYSRRYVYLYTERKPVLTKSEALALVLSELY